MTTIQLPEEAWAQTVASVADEMDVAIADGLDEDAVARRRKTFGENVLRKAERRSVWEIWIEQFKSLVVLLLIAAAALSFIFGEWIDGSAILIVVLVNAGIGFVTELKAVRSMEALQAMGDVRAKVRRQGGVREVTAEALVPGDIVILESGDVVTADLRLVEAAKLQANESALTGESVPVGKTSDPVAAETPLAERRSMVYKGTAITRGSGEGIVVRTGMDTELGQISSLVEEAEAEETPLEERLDELGRRLIVATLVIAAVLAVTGILQGRDMLQMLETAIALAVAAIPEGLPIVATIALARGMRRMAQRQALVNRLAAVETLGSTNIICSDKTGTLTENQMTATEIFLPGGKLRVGGEGLERAGEFRRNGEAITPDEAPLLRQALTVGVLCNNATLPAEGDTEDVTGDPVEVALLVAGAKAGLSRPDLLANYPEKREVAFDPEVKMMATYHKKDDTFRVAIKGAPKEILTNCTQQATPDGSQALHEEERETWLARNKEMARAGLRVLALAEKESERTDEYPYRNLTFLGLVGLLDPPREEVHDALEACQQAGIRVVMITGDQPATARRVAEAVGLVPDGKKAQVIVGPDLGDPAALSPSEQEQIRETPILARVSPKQKLDLIDIYQQQGLTVAMTGDGVNDAPALKKANIGVAMGERGTQVAREAADMVLQDDAFATIVVAVRQGRTIFNNIRKFVLYLLSCNLSEILTVGLASLFALPLPLLPLQILFLNLVTDVFPALALGVGEGDPDVMKRPPRAPDEPILMRHHWYTMVAYGALITVAVLAALGVALTWLDMRRAQAVTVSFLTLAFAQLWNVFNMRDVGSGLLSNEISRNRYVWGALGLCTVLLLIAVYVPVLSDVLKTTAPGVEGWLLVAGMSLIPLAGGQIMKEMGFGRIASQRLDT